MTTPQPYTDPAINYLYEMLFADAPALFQAGAPEGSPWAELLGAYDPVALARLAQDPEAEARVRLLACHRLRVGGHPLTHRELLGVIVEVSLPEGLDVLAAYADGAARYLNHSGKVLIWETPDVQSNELIDELFFHCANIVNQIGPWEGGRGPFPVTGYVRLTMLVTDGVYIGEAPMDVFFQDALAGPALATATYLLQYLTDKAGQDS
ncbi:MAG: hypothetical protein SF053_17185 [Bacteroidia bacterium]|nr:hypothetical protein [Bacteroidia bacterium]